MVNVFPSVWLGVQFMRVAARDTRCGASKLLRQCASPGRHMLRLEAQFASDRFMIEFSACTGRGAANWCGVSEVPCVVGATLQQDGAGALQSRRNNTASHVQCCFPSHHFELD